jgi:hypothetical protein
MYVRLALGVKDVCAFGTFKILELRMLATVDCQYITIYTVRKVYTIVYSTDSM